MAKKNSGTTRAPKNPARHAAASAKVSRRRLLAMGAGAVAASALPTVLVMHDGRPSGRLARLADHWDAAACNFDLVRQAVLFPVSGFAGGEPLAANSPEMQRYRAAADTMLAHADRVFHEKSRKGADVLLKYDLMDQLMDGRHVPDRDAILAAGGGDWHRIIEEEARAYGLTVNPFWLWDCPRTPVVDGDARAAIAKRILHRRTSQA